VIWRLISRDILVLKEQPIAAVDLLQLFTAIIVWQRRRGVVQLCVQLARS
jgi:hypothetical protein